MGQIHEKYIAFHRKYIPSHKNYNYYDTKQDRRQVLRAKTRRDLRTIDPFGGRDLRVKVTDVATATGLQKGTVSKALKVLIPNF